MSLGLVCITKPATLMVHLLYSFLHVCMFLLRGGLRDTATTTTPGCDAWWLGRLERTVDGKLCIELSSLELHEEYLVSVECMHVCVVQPVLIVTTDIHTCLLYLFIVHVHFLSRGWSRDTTTDCDIDVLMARMSGTELQHVSVSRSNVAF